MLAYKLYPENFPFLVCSLMTNLVFVVVSLFVFWVHQKRRGNYIVQVYPSYCILSFFSSKFYSLNIFVKKNTHIHILKMWYFLAVVLGQTEKIQYFWSISLIKQLWIFPIYIYLLPGEHLQLIEGVPKNSTRNFIQCCAVVIDRKLYRSRSMRNSERFDPDPSILWTGKRVQW